MAVVSEEVSEVDLGDSEAAVLAPLAVVVAEASSEEAAAEASLEAVEVVVPEVAALESRLTPHRRL